MKIIETDRVILRTWDEKDIEPYYLINQDPKVIEFLRGPLSLEEVQDFVHRMNKQYAELHFTLWAAQEKSSNKLMGFVGLNPPKWESHFTPCVEIGWRLGSEFWGKGYATEAAKAVLHYGFNIIGLTEIVSFTVPANTRSIRVMEKLGMKRDINGDFLHPWIPPTHSLSHHIIYKIQKP